MKQDSRDRILRAATALFAERGYDSVSLRDITAAAGVNISMISYYFGGKQGLYDAALTVQLRALTAFLSLDVGTMDPRALIRAYAELALQAHEEHPHLLKYIFRTLLSPPAKNPGFFESTVSRIYDMLSCALTRGQEEGLFREDLDVPSAVLLLVGTVNFHYITTPVRDRMTAEGRVLPDERTYVMHAVDVFLRGIAKPQAPESSQPTLPGGNQGL